MVTTVPGFDTTLSRTMQWLHEVQTELNLNSEQRSYMALRAVLHALRDRLTIEEAAEFAAQLPMLVRGFYYEGYVPSGKPLKMNQHKFLDHVEREITADLDAEYISKGIFFILERKISDGEIHDIKSVLPDDIISLWPGAEGWGDEDNRAGVQE